MSYAKPTMLTYIQETPDQLDLNNRRARELVGSLVDAYVAGKYERTVLVACGSSFNAAQCAKPFMIKYLQHDVQVIPPESFNCYKNKFDERDFVISISQSGCSTNSIATLKKLHSLGRPAIGLTGNSESDFKDHADILVDYGVDKETVGYVTKGVTTLVQFLMLFALAISEKKGLIELTQIQKAKEELSGIPDKNKAVQDKTVKFFEEHYKELTSMEVIYSCGFAQGYGVACESALKMGETIKIPSFAYEAEEFIHGPNLQLTPKYSLFFYDDLGVNDNRVLSVYKATRTVSDKAYIVTNRWNTEDQNVIDLPFKIQEPLLASLYMLPVPQLISYLVATELDTWKEHPAFKRFKKVVSSKTESIEKIMPY